MNWFKRDQLVSVTILVAFLSVGIEGWLLGQTRGQAARAVAALEQKRRERETLQQQSPALSEENEQAIVRELAATNEKLEEIRLALKGEETSDPAPPGKPIDAYFEIANFVEKTRNLAARSHVAIRPEERFGFGSHTSEGPGVELLPDVLRQCATVQILVASLFESHPAALISVQREYPLSAAQRAERSQGRYSGKVLTKSPGGHNELLDFFELEPAVSLRIPDEIETDAFKLEFSGQTGALRAFLNRLAQSEYFFAVRTVQVGPLDSPVTKVSTKPSVATAVPIVGQVLSRFSVIVESVRPLDAMKRAVP